jgi:acyl carrier protein
MPDRKRLVRCFIVDNLLFGDDAGLADDTPFFAEGIVDSTGFLELVLFLEETFDIRLEDDEVVPENLDSLDLIDRFLEKKLVGAAPPVGLPS